MKWPKISYFKKDIFTFLLFTILGILDGQVSVFYLIYFFWFQELIRTIIDTRHVYIHQKQINSNTTSNIWGAYILLFVYFIFIVFMFGIAFAWHNKSIVYQNVKTLIFLNIFFDLNIVLFAIEYYKYRKNQKEYVTINAFNKNQILLHISIILGGIMHGIISPKVTHNPNTISLLTILPFILLKMLINYRSDKNSKTI